MRRFIDAVLQFPDYDFRKTALYERYKPMAH